MTDRLAGLRHWLQQVVGIDRARLVPASADASFRRYFRLVDQDPTLILMDAPPPQEDCRPYVALAEAFAVMGLNVPRVLEADLEQGYLLISDLGSRTYLNELDPASADRLYRDALDALLRLQAAPLPDYPLPAYDRPMLLREMGLFDEWFLQRHLGLQPGTDGRAALAEAFELLADSALAQPTVCVHRDYHSRNLMVQQRRNPGILDFQDAVVGPLTYDVVSLLRDCYIAWPAERVRGWAVGYRRAAVAAGVRCDADDEQFLQWFDLMGMQRHLKAIGIFARLYRRDGKPGYLGDIPRTLDYVREVAARTPALRAFDRWLQLELPAERVGAGLAAVEGRA